MEQMLHRNSKYLERLLADAGYELMVTGHGKVTAGKLDGETDYENHAVQLRVARPSQRGLRILAHEAGNVLLHGLNGPEITSGNFS